MAEFVTGSAGSERRTLAVSGEVDLATIEEFLAEADACLDATAETVEIDLGEVTFIDSSGLGALVRIRNAARDRSKVLVLTNVPASVERLFAVTGLSEAFEIRSKA
jgi:anti-anti-sigma factor